MVIYIGITNDLKKRIKYQHFGSGVGGHLPFECYKETKKIETHACKSLEDAKLRERYLINTDSPKYNTTYNSNSIIGFTIKEWSWSQLSLDIYDFTSKTDFKKDKQFEECWKDICKGQKHGYSLKLIYKTLKESKRISTDYRLFKLAVDIKKATVMFKAEFARDMKKIDNMIKKATKKKGNECNYRIRKSPDWVSNTEQTKNIDIIS